MKLRVIAKGDGVLANHIMTVVNKKSILEDTYMTLTQILSRLGVDENIIQGGELVVHSPIDGAVLGQIKVCSSEEVESAISEAQAAS